jgi:hypothetical protein
MTTTAEAALHCEEVGGRLEPDCALELPRDGAPITIDFEVRLPYGLPGTSQHGAPFLVRGAVQTSPSISLSPPLSVPSRPFAHRLSSPPAMFFLLPSGLAFVHHLAFVDCAGPNAKAKRHRIPIEVEVRDFLPPAPVSIASTQEDQPTCFSGGSSRGTVEVEMGLFDRVHANSATPLGRHFGVNVQLHNFRARGGRLNKVRMRLRLALLVVVATPFCLPNAKHTYTVVSNCVRASDPSVEHVTRAGTDNLTLCVRVCGRGPTYKRL